MRWIEVWQPELWFKHRRQEIKELRADKNTLLLQKEAMTEFINEKGLGKEAELVVRAKIYEKTNAPKPQKRSKNYQIGD